MANQLKMAKIQAIRALHEQRWSQRRIAGELDVERETFAKYVRAGACIPKPAKAPIGSESKPAKAPIGSEPVSGAFVSVQVPPGSVVGIEASTATNSLEEGCSRSACEPYRQVILEKLELGLLAPWVYPDLGG